MNYSSYRRFGIKGYTHLAINKVRRLIYGGEIKEHIYLMRDLQKDFPIPEMDYRQLELKDFEYQASLPNGDKKWFNKDKIEKIASYFKQPGQIAYGHYEGEILASYGWINLNGFNLGKYQLTKEDGYLWDDYTNPEFRGRGLQKASILFRMKVLKDMCRLSAWSSVAPHNKASYKNYLRAGFKPKLKITNIIKYYH